MEDVLDLYQDPYEAERPVVCMDEASKQLVEGVQPHIGMNQEARKPGTDSCSELIEIRRVHGSKSHGIWLAPEWIPGFLAGCG